MNTLIKKEQTGLTFDNAKSYAAGTGLLVAGFLVAHNGLRLIKMQDNVLVNLGLTVASVVGAMAIENPWAKLALLGIAAYGATKTLTLAVKEVAAPGATGAGGLSGFIPESIKANIRSFLPTIGTVGEWDYVGNTNEDNAFNGDLNLDENHNMNGESENLLGENSENLLGETSSNLL